MSCDVSYVLVSYVARALFVGVDRTLVGVHVPLPLNFQKVAASIAVIILIICAVSSLRSKREPINLEHVFTKPALSSTPKSPESTGTYDRLSYDSSTHVSHAAIIAANTPVLTTARTAYMFCQISQK